MDGQQGASLTLMAEKIMQTPVNAKQFTFCPSMNLLALATTDEQVHVFRSNGQRVFGVTRDESASSITCMQWKPDASAHTGKVMYRKKSLTSSKAPICHLGWATHFTDIQAVRISLAQPADHLTLDELIKSVEKATETSGVPDLPTELALIDVSTSLPKLSTLPIGGSQGDVFSSKTSLETLFRPLSTHSAESADVLVIGHEDGTIHISMSEDFAIGRFVLEDMGSKLTGTKLFLHRYHPYSTTHALLVSPEPDHLDFLQLIPFDLRHLSSAGKYLSLLAAKVTELHNLQRYLCQVQEQIANEIRTSQDLPSRFMRNIDESLRERSDCTWVQAAYHFVVTGHCYPDVKEWLVDELGERGHKRWDKAVTMGYETVRRLTHENLLPALDRMGVLISRLRGLSRFQPSDIMLGLSTLELDNMLDSVHCLQLVSHHLQKCVGLELQQFAHFSAWLRHEIERQAVDPGTASAQEIVDRDTDFDYGSILEYVQGAMTHSQMSIYSGSHGDTNSQLDLDAGGGLLFELYKKGLIAVGAGYTERKHLPGLDGLVVHFQRQSDSFFEHISESQRRNVHFGIPVQLGQGVPACTDMRMVDETNSEASACFSVYVAIGPSQSQSYVNITRVTLAIESGVSSTKSVKHAWVPTPAGTVRSLRFIDDEFIMLALVGPGGKLCFLDPKVLARHTIHQFPAGQAWTPQTLEIKGRVGKVVCVLAEDKIHYRQYSIEGLDEEADDSEKLDLAMSNE
ncbi:MAG: hypothetical protein Q9228_000798 [Teloschistes exilis]